MNINQRGFKPIEPKTERKLILYLPQNDGTWQANEEYGQDAEDMVRSPEWDTPYRIMEEITTTECRVIKEQK